MTRYFKVTAVSILLILAAVVSATFVADWAMSPESHAGTIASIDDKVNTVKLLTASSTMVSIGVTAIPDDIATPIAEKLADCTEYFLIVLCVLYAEKYLLTLLGVGVFRILIPFACVLAIPGIAGKSSLLKRFSMKLAVVGLLLFLVIPISIKASDMIYSTYQYSIDETIAQAQDLTGKTDAVAEAQNNTTVLESVLSYFKETTTGLTGKASDILNRFTETIAVMLVTTCIIPILVLLFFVWLIKAVFGVALPLPARGRRPGKTRPPVSANALADPAVSEVTGPGPYDR